MYEHHYIDSTVDPPNVLGRNSWDSLLVDLSVSDSSDYEGLGLDEVNACVWLC